MPSDCLEKIESQTRISWLHWKVLYVIYTDTKIQISTKSKRNHLTKSFCLEQKVMDLSLLPPWQSTLYLHILLSSYVARIRKCYLLNVVNCPSIMENSWIESREMQCLGWWCLSTRYYGNLVWWRFWQRKHGTRIRSSRWLYYWKYWWLKLQFHLLYTLITIPFSLYVIFTNH